MKLAIEGVPTVWRWRKRIDRANEELWRKRIAAFVQDDESQQVVVTAPVRSTRCHLDVYCAEAAQARKLKNDFGGETSRIDPETWLTLPPRPPVRVARGLWVVGESVDELPASAPADARRIAIPASIAFGTGEHPTTAMLLRAMGRDFVRERPARVLDVGTGTGLLALAAVALGATEVVGIDTQESAIRLAAENEEANRQAGEPDIAWACADLAKWKSRTRFDVVLANVYAEILADNAKNLVARARVGGRLYLTGILKQREQLVRDAYEAEGCELIERKRTGRWIFLKYQRA